MLFFKIIFLVSYFLYKKTIEHCASLFFFLKEKNSISPLVRMISFHHTSWKVFISLEDEIRGCFGCYTVSPKKF